MKMEGAAEEVSILAKHTVRPSPRANKEEGEAKPERIHLTAWDLEMIFAECMMQKCILFHKPRDQSMDVVISNLLTSFSHVLNHYYPLAGRLSTTKHNDNSSISISLDCTDEGAEFIHASASHLKISDFLSSYYVPPIIHSFFPLDGKINYEGHSSPLLAAQITELEDGIFIACSINHAIADGTTFWKFFNAWSSICRTNKITIEHPPVLERWFPASCPPPIQLPFTDHQQFIKKVIPPLTKKCALNFTAESIKKLKTKANEEMMGRANISSLQALLANAWRAVTRARCLEFEEETTFILFVGYRTRLSPPLPQTYVGNVSLGVPIKALAGDLETKGLGWTAWQLNQVVAAQREEKVYDWWESWTKSPSFTCADKFGRTHLSSGSSPKFDCYGNDFGWGRPVAVRSGHGLKLDGKMEVYPGPEEGSMTVEVVLNEKALKALIADKEFMEVVEKCKSL